MKFPKDFYWGGATAANQFEGGWNLGGRIEGISDHLTLGSRKEPRRFTETINPNEHYPSHKGSDFYHRYKEDIALLAELGIKMFRISLNWARIYPTGIEDTPNQQGLDFYRNVFEECKKYNIEPLVTLYHADMPYYLSTKYDGWYNRKTIHYFMKYTETVFNEYKGLVKYWLTFNEINSALHNGTAYMVCGMSSAQSKDLNAGVIDSNVHEKNIKNDTEKQYQCVHNMYLASAKAVQLAHEINPNYQVGCMIAGICQYPYTCDPKDMILSTVARQNLFWLSSDVMVRGAYPSYSKRIFNELGFKLNLEANDVATLKAGTVDFYSFSYYSTGCVTTHEDTLKTTGNMVFGVANPYLETSEWGWQIDPTGLRYFLNEIYDRYQKPIMVVENGLGQEDKLNDDKTINDSYRIQYLKEHIQAMADALADGVELLAYTAWGIIDLPAASTGEMKKRYGVIYVDTDDFGNGSYDRYKKDSFYWYQKVITSNGEDLD